MLPQGTQLVEAEAITVLLVGELEVVALALATPPVEALLYLFVHAQLLLSHLVVLNATPVVVQATTFVSLLLDEDALVTAEAIKQVKATVALFVLNLVPQIRHAPEGMVL